MVLSFASGASASPGEEELRKEIDRFGKSLTVVVEKYNQAREKLKATKLKAAKLNKELKPLQDRVDRLYAETGAMAAAAYKGGQASMVDAILGSGSPATLIDQMSTLEILAGKRNAQIRTLNLAKADLDQKKAAIDALLGEQTKLAKDLAAKKKQIQGQIDKLEEMYEKTYGPLNPPQPPPADPPAVSSGDAQTVVNFVHAQLGEPYVFGAEGPGSWDCSGLTMMAYRQIGVSLPHSASGQWSATRRVSRSNLRPGDIVFFYSDLHHNGIYIGGGMMIHAPQPGEYVEKISMSYMPYAGAGRP
jgi:cell wall-associated NlpC family hydrolase